MSMVQEIKCDQCGQPYNDIGLCACEIEDNQNVI